MTVRRLVLLCCLLFAATPLLAIQCETCTEPYYLQGCEATPGSGTRCWFTIDWCDTIGAPSCTRFTPDTQVPVLADWTVASIEVQRPDGSRVVTAPPAVANAERSAADSRK